MGHGDHAIHSRDILHEKADMFIPEHEFDCTLLYQRIEAFLTKSPISIGIAILSPVTFKESLLNRSRFSNSIFCCLPISTANSAGLGSATPGVLTKNFRQNVLSSNRIFAEPRVPFLYSECEKHKEMDIIHRLSAPLKVKTF